jgi:hypothetical protein
MFHYQAQLNAALNVKVLELPFSSWEELATTDLDVLVTSGSAYSDAFEFAPIGSTKSQIYKNQIQSIPIEEQLGSIGYAGAVTKVLEGNTILLTEMQPMMQMNVYPCEMIDIKTIVLVCC